MTEMPKVGDLVVHKRCLAVVCEAPAVTLHTSTQLATLVRIKNLDGTPLRRSIRQRSEHLAVPWCYLEKAI